MNSRALFIAAIAAAAGLYIGDSLRLWHRIQQGHEAFGTYQVEHYSAVPEKNNKVEFFYDPPETVECVHALFPHQGDAPCWYANRTREKRTDL